MEVDPRAPHVSALPGMPGTRLGLAVEGDDVDANPFRYANAPDRKDVADR